MVRTKLLRLSLCVIVCIALLHVFATVFFLYSYIWWFDIPLHILGGFCAGLISLAVIYAIQNKKGVQTFAYVFLSTLALGLLWELFEYSAGITYNAIGNYGLDTLKDLAMDVFGGVGAYGYFILKGYNH